MTKTAKSLIVSLLVVAMVLFGLLLPSLVEHLASGGSGNMETIEVEALNFESGSSSAIEILRRMNNYEDPTSILSTQELAEGYRYTMETARAHVKELLVNFLSSCGLTGTANFYDEHFEEFGLNQEAMMIATAEYPVPWSAVIWGVDSYQGADLYLVFDDASGAMLGCSIPLYGDAELFAKQGLETERDAAETCVTQFAEQMNAAVSYETEISNGEFYYHLTDKDGETAYVRLYWDLDADKLPVLVISGEVADYERFNTMVDQWKP